MRYRVSKYQYIPVYISKQFLSVGYLVTDHSVNYYTIPSNNSSVTDGSGYYLNQASLFTLEVDLGVSQCRKGETNSSQTPTIVMVIKQSLGSWSHMWSLGKVSGCGSTSLFGSRTGTHQGK